MVMYLCKCCSAVKTNTLDIAYSRHLAYEEIMANGYTTVFSIRTFSR